jgi:uncharacterized Tic20 family protein
MEAGLHSIFPGSICSFLGFLTSLLIRMRSHVNPSLEFVDLYNLIFGLMLTLILPVIIWICWLIVRRIHPVIDLAGQDAIDCALNNLIVILSLAFIFGTTCGVLNLNPSIASNILNSSLVVCNLVAIAYSINSAIASIFTLRGNQFKNRFIYPFIRNE